ncbi:UDP-3-O-[3-hydroxymyristoyl] N-acetylglucosamine deacetylase [Candidatus Brocadiaceae bacterium B188]|nr:UDP-3-O-[3-hydroxymyristoyl] N-acetylglucosamine deacetylase [Candidatus Brocadia sapporoensis]OQZ04684.1 MAG: UDP-3-O-[3-hydroxymyristoyl] N-acetylglucosamine deacetylase [Candidatus Brocadia sp. UTAMX1]QQR66355.1 MAG: UDP-3-O-[3-hydroxymyristoyl] N-acetylglucosamine deacetylase [Candidatus Brocadia sp.]RZV58673.1 MAG: UDP-3-O-[3-hydroxymyristoyl] N-acetylglucosamine deacetylase [Candidatus Brocadia sp. BROELEC01]TWU53316.1 UDP-3-O-[3-hydroxymyristoyl] N-acetylglucosamine deacetylase [Candi
MVNTQKTIGQEIGCAGIGMFRGENTTLHFKPALLNSGISFVRVDLPNRPRISAHVGSLSSNYRRIFLKRGDAEVECVEHLMAALAGLGIDNIEIEINGSEVPAGDGSAQLFVEILKKAGVVDLGGVKKVFVVKEPMGVNNGNASILAVPYEKGLALSYTLDFNNSFLQQQTYDIEVTEESFCREIASARTFGLSTYIEEFRRLGLGKGVTDENSIMVHEDGTMTKPVSQRPAELRFPGELVRHKILDLIGDLYLANVVIQGRIIAKRSGHSLNVRLAEMIVNNL